MYERHLLMTVYGYARVSSNGQTLANQDAALAAAGVAKTYREKVSAVATRRPEHGKGAAQARSR